MPRALPSGVRARHACEMLRGVGVEELLLPRGEGLGARQAPQVGPSLVERGEAHRAERRRARAERDPAHARQRPLDVLDGVGPLRDPPQVGEQPGLVGGQGAGGHGDRRLRAGRRVQFADVGAHAVGHQGSRGEGDVHAVRAQARRLPVVLPRQQVRGDGEPVPGGALAEDGQHRLGEVAGVHVVPPFRQGDGQCAGRAAHVQHRVRWVEREEFHEPVLVGPGGRAGERCGPFVPVLPGIAVEHDSSAAASFRHCSMPLGYCFPRPGSAARLPP